MDNEAKASRRKRWQLGIVALVVILACALSFLIPPNDNAASYDTESIAQLIASGPSTKAVAQEVTMTLQISPGPYFLGELVAAEMTLTNDSATAYALYGASGGSGCSAAMWTGLSDGVPPTYTLPTTGFGSCLGVTGTLSPGHTWTTDELFALTTSGSVTLAAQARFYGASAADGTQVQTEPTGPFAQQWPELTISVAPTAPPGRAIALHSSPRFLIRAPQVTIDAPAAARSRLYYIFDAKCSGQGSDEAESLTWRSLTSDTLDDPGCEGSNEVWHYSVGAPGYEIASGVYRANG